MEWNLSVLSGCFFRLVMSMAVHPSDLDEGTSLAALDLEKMAWSAPFVASPNSKSWTIFEQSSCFARKTLAHLLWICVCISVIFV